MPAAGGALRAVARARTEQEFVRSFAPFVERDTLFIPTSSTRPVGTRQRFVMVLADGEPVMQGEAEIIECFSNKDGPGSRNGLRLRVISLDEQSRAIHERLLERAASVARKHSQSLRAQTAAPAENKTPDERVPAPDKLPAPDLGPDSDEPTIVKPLADLDKPAPAQKSAALDKPAPRPRTTVAFEAPRGLEPTKLPDKSTQELATNRTPPARPRQDTLIGTPSPPINAALAAMIEPRTPAIGSPRQSSPNFTDLKEKPTPVVGIERAISEAAFGTERAPQKSAPELTSTAAGVARAPQKSAPELASTGVGRVLQKPAPPLASTVAGVERTPHKSASELASALGVFRAPQKSAPDIAAIDSSELRIASPAAPPPAPSALARERQGVSPELPKAASGALRLQAMRMHSIEKGPSLPKLPEPAKPPPREPKPEEPKRPAEPVRNPLKEDPASARAILIKAIKSNRPAPKKSDELPPAEVRVPGSDLILPANPFGDLSPTALEQFIECTLFDAGPNAGEPAATGSAFPPPMPASIAAPAPYPSYVPGPLTYEGIERPPDSRIAPDARVPSVPAPSAVALAPPISAAPPPMPPSMPPYQPSVPAPAALVAAQSEERTWTSRLLALTLAIVAGAIVAALGIGAGYVLRDVAGQRAQSKTTPLTTGAAEAHSAVSDPAKLEEAETNTAPPPASMAAPQTVPSAAPAESGSAAAAPPNGESCEASIRTDPPGATVRWNGDNLGTTPLDDVRVPCTDATVILELSRYVPRQHKVTPAPTAPISIFEKLLHADAQLFVASSVPGTTFQVNGVAIGAAPTSTWVQTGTYAEVFAFANGRAFWSVRRAINRRVVYVRVERTRKADVSAMPADKSSTPEPKRERASTKPEKPTASEPKKKLPSGI